MDSKARSQLTRLWMESQSSLLAFILSGVGNFTDAEDILQQVAHDVSVYFSKYDSARPFIPWAMVIAKRRVADYYRRNKRSIRLFDVIDLELLSEAHLAFGDQDARSGEYADQLERCIERLPERSRKLIELRYHEDLKPSAIAKYLGRSPGSIRVALSKIRSVLGDCIRSTAVREGSHGA